MRTFAILPVKRFDAAKQRLGSALSASARRALVRAMVHDVLDALDRVRGIRRIVVVPAEEPVRALAAARGDVVVDDPVQAGQSEAATLGIAAARRRGAERVLLVPGDCPALWPQEVDAMLRRHDDGPGVVVVPDRHGQGTNGLLLTPPDAIAPAFGPGSLARHATLAAGAGATVRIVRVASLELDVDTPGDLAAVRERLGDRPDSGPRPQALLERMPSPAASA